MRTTVALDDDVARAVDELRRTEGLSTSAAVNALARRGIAGSTEVRPPFLQEVSSMGRPRLPLDDVAAALEVLEVESRAG